MKILRYILPLLLILYSQSGTAAEPITDIDRDILITFENDGASVIGGGVSAPYRNRIRSPLTQEEVLTTLRNSSPLLKLITGRSGLWLSIVSCTEYRKGQIEKRLLKGSKTTSGSSRFNHYRNSRPDRITLSNTTINTQNCSMA